MAILLLTMLVILIGAKAIYKDRFAVLTGTAQNGQVTINYPEGFNKDNSIIISNMFKRVGASETRGFSIGTTFVPADGTSGSLPNSIELQSSGIVIKLKYIYLSNGNTSTVSNVDYDIAYKIVLMKID